MTGTMNDPHYIGLPPPVAGHVTQTREFFQALDNFTRTFAFRPGDKVLFLTDPLLDTRVVEAISGHAKARGATVRQLMEPSSRVERIHDDAKPLLEQATFVVST